VSAETCLDTETIKNAANGRWPEIFASQANVSPAILDGKHHPCPKCGGTDRFRVFDDFALTGGMLCNNCFTAGNGDGIAGLQWLLDCDFKEAMRHIAGYLGIANGNGHVKPGLLMIVGRINRMPVDSARTYGAHVEKRGKLDVVRFPVVNERGETHSHFDFPGDASKGWFKKGKGNSGIFLPVDDGKPKLPAAEENWILCEGVQDACAYHSLGYLACGLPTDNLAVKYVRLFRGCHVIIMPGRTVDAEDKARRSAARLQGVAASVRIGTLPLEIGTDKDDARDVLAMPDGERQLRQAVEDATMYQPSKPGCRPTIFVDSRITPVADTLRQVTEHLIAARNCFSRAGQLVVINDESIIPILVSAELGGLLSQHAEFFFGNEDAGNFKPLPNAYGNTWLNNFVERKRLPNIKLFTRNPVYTEDWRLVNSGYDSRSCIYYAGPPVIAQDSTRHLDALLHDFCFKKPADRTNYIGMLLTVVLVPHFIGAKPAALFNGNQPELGKSILAQIIAVLRDGHPTETATYNPNDEEFEKRLGAIVHRGATTIIIDNAKASGRHPRIESACLERSITDPILSFRLLGKSVSIRVENSHIICITANTPQVGRDLVTRSVVINLYFEGNPERRSFTIADPEGYAEQYRIELLGELVGMVERWKAAGMPMANVHSRFNKRGWGNIVGGILEVAGEPDFLANAEEAAATLDETRREFAELVAVLADHPQGIWTASELVELCEKHRLLAADLGEGSPKSLQTKMGTLAGRFVTERFPLGDGRQVVFRRSDGRKGKVYQVFVEDESPSLRDCPL